jgi:Tfp pilus assembly protein PilO
LTKPGIFVKIQILLVVFSLGLRFYISKKLSEKTTLSSQNLQLFNKYVM